MNSLQISEEKKVLLKTEKANCKSNTNDKQACEIAQPRPMTPVAVPETSEEVSTKNELSIPENRFKLKPEQSYKKETKASRLGKSTGRWTQKEHLLFIEGLKIYGK